MLSNVSTWHQEKELLVINTTGCITFLSSLVGPRVGTTPLKFCHGSSKEAPSPRAIGRLQMRCPSQSCRAEKDHKRGTLQEKKLLNWLEVKSRQVCLKYYHSFKGKKQKMTHNDTQLHLSQGIAIISSTMLWSVSGVPFWKAAQRLDSTSPAPKNSPRKIHWQQHGRSPGHETLEKTFSCTQLKRNLHES